MANSSNIDYTTFFAVKVLPKIHGEPNYVNLKNLRDHLKANASRVTSELGGGAKGHLGLILTALDYTLVSPTPYVRPLHPGPLIIPPGTTQHASTLLRKQHKKAIVLFHQTTDLENALKKQITDSIDNCYYKDIVDCTTNTITHDIPFILNYFFTNYGEVEAETLYAKANKVCNMPFTIQHQLTSL